MIIQRVKSAVILALSAVNGGTNSGAHKGDNFGVMSCLYGRLCWEVTSADSSLWCSSAG